jgi:hypothetical protein
MTDAHGTELSSSSTLLHTAGDRGAEPQLHPMPEHGVMGSVQSDERRPPPLVKPSKPIQNGLLAPRSKSVRRIPLTSTRKDETAVWY